MTGRLGVSTTPAQALAPSREGQGQGCETRYIRGELPFLWPWRSPRVGLQQRCSRTMGLCLGSCCPRGHTPPPSKGCAPGRDRVWTLLGLMPPPGMVAPLSLWAWHPPTWEKDVEGDLSSHLSGHPHPLIKRAIKQNILPEWCDVTEIKGLWHMVRRFRSMHCCFLHVHWDVTNTRVLSLIQSTFFLPFLCPAPQFFWWRNLVKVRLWRQETLPGCPSLPQESSALQCAPQSLSLGAAAP